LQVSEKKEGYYKKVRKNQGGGDLSYFIVEGETKLKKKVGKSSGSPKEVQQTQSYEKLPPFLNSATWGVSGEIRESSWRRSEEEDRALLVKFF